MTSAIKTRTGRAWLITACAVPMTAAVMCGATGPATADAGSTQPIVNTALSDNGHASDARTVPATAPATMRPHAPNTMELMLPLVKAAQPVTETANRKAVEPMETAQPIALHSDSLRYGKVQTPRPNWLPRPTADQINAGAAQVKTQIDAGWNAIGVPPQQRVAVGAAAAGAYGAVIGGVATAVPSAVAGALGGAVIGAVIGGCIGGAPTAGAGMPAGALIGGIIGAGVGAVGAGAAGGLAGAAAVGTEAGLAGAAVGALGS